MSIKFVLNLSYDVTSHHRLAGTAYQKNYLLFPLTFKEIFYISDRTEGPGTLKLELGKLVLAYKEKEFLFPGGKAEINS